MTPDTPQATLTANIKSPTDDLPWYDNIGLLDIRELEMQISNTLSPYTRRLRAAASACFDNPGEESRLAFQALCKPEDIMLFTRAYAAHLARGGKADLLDGGQSAPAIKSLLKGHCDLGRWSKGEAITHVQDIDYLTPTTWRDLYKTEVARFEQVFKARPNRVRLGVDVCRRLASLPLGAMDFDILTVPDTEHSHDITFYREEEPQEGPFAPCPSHYMTDELPVKPRGVLISFEGLDGSGKTTQIELLRKRLEESGLSVAVFREPGGTPLGEEVRNLLLHKHDLSISPLAELMLFLASRAQLVHDKIKPLLQAGTIVLLDRFLDSTVAYQGYGRELGQRLVLDANHVATGGLEPDMTIWLDVLPEEARTWLSQAGVPDRIEQQGEEFHALVRQGFKDQAESNPRRIKRVNGWREKEEVHRGVWQLFLYGVVQADPVKPEPPAQHSVWLNRPAGDVIQANTRDAETLHSTDSVETDEDRLQRMSDKANSVLAAIDAGKAPPTTTQCPVDVVMRRVQEDTVRSQELDEVKAQQPAGLTPENCPVGWVVLGHASDCVVFRVGAIKAVIGLGDQVKLWLGDNDPFTVRGTVESILREIDKQESRGYNF